MISKEHSSRFAYLILAGFTILLALTYVVADGFAPAGRRLARVAGVDPPAYFGVSHSLLFDHNFDLTNEFQRVPPDENPWTRVRPETGKPGSAYAIGYSLLSMPFLAAGTALDAVTGHPADGFSRFAMLGYCLANLLMTGIGLMATFRLLSRAGALWGITGTRASWYALIATGAIFFGTTVAYYAFSQMSHAATFFCSSIFLAWWWEIRERTTWRSWALLGLIGGLLSVSRWQEMFFVFSPFVFDVTGKDMWRSFVPWLRSRSVYLGVVALCWIPQFLEWKAIYGKWLANPYGSVLEIPPPWLGQVMFSSQNGWFFWTPLALIGVLGMIVGLVKFGRAFLPGLVVMALEVTLVASVKAQWQGGDAFGCRYLTSSAPFIGLGLVTLLYAGSKVTRTLTVAVAAACCLYTCLMAAQYRLDLIPRGQRLTAGEAFHDKLHLLDARRRKSAVDRAGDLLQQGSGDGAVKTLEDARANYGDSRELLSEIRTAYEKQGREGEAEEAGRELDALMQSRLW
jgi:hypothetical protein